MECGDGLRRAGSFGALLVPVDGRSPSVPFSESLRPSFETYIGEGWIHRDIRYRAVPAMLRRGAASEFDYITAEEIGRHPYYQEWLAGHGLRWFALVKVSFGEDLWALSIQRSIAQGPFSPDEVNRLARLSPSLAAAGALARALGFARAEAALAAFEVSGLAVALIDRLGAVIRLNAAAERLLGPHLKIVRGRIASSDHDATAALDRALHALLWASGRRALAPPVLLPRPEKRPLLAYAVRPPGICADALVACQAVVVFVDPEARPLPREAHLRSALGLSAAEARLAAKLAAGDTLKTAAEVLGISRETARVQLKSVFAKTDTYRQAELVALIDGLREPNGNPFG
jgi:DNA-binding CsgD family transcriptional regulator/PAS domain-containing protein